MPPDPSEPSPPEPPAPSPAAARPPERGLVARGLDLVERIGNRLADPLTFFAVFAALVVAVSWLAARASVSVTHPGTGATVTAVNLASAAGVRRMLAEAVKNFSAFPPLGTVLVTMIGVGLAERSGFFDTALRRFVTLVPRWALPATLIFAGINASAAADAGIVVLPPLGALLFVSFRRHPLAGLTAAFAGVSGGFSANLVVTALDPLLSGLTEPAARLVDSTYRVEPTANYYFMIASTFLLTVTGTFVNARWVEPRFGPWPAAAATEAATGAGEGEAEAEAERALTQVTPEQRRALWIAFAAGLAVPALAAALAIPAHGVLRDESGSLRPFYDSIVTLMMLAFLVPGLAYGIAARTIRSDKDVARMIGDTLATMGPYIALAFIAAQFVAYFSWSNLGLILAVKGAGALKEIGLTGIPLLLGFVFVCSTINFFIASASAKWAVMSSVFVPMLMLLGYSPEAAQACYRVGDSITNVVTPLLPYYPLLIAYARKYDPRCGLGTLLSATLPYSVGFGIAWAAMLIVWIFLSLPFGPGAPLHYAPPGLAP